MLNAKLVVVGGDAKVSEFQLKLPTTIGRSREAKLKLPHPLVSRKHCEIFEREGQLFVRDLGSLNGTYVDSQKIDREQALQPNQLLTLGTVTFRAIYDLVESANGSPAPQSNKADLSDRPTKKATAETGSAPSAPKKEIAAVGTERNDPAGDTDKNLPVPSEIDFAEIAAEKARPADVPSSIFVGESKSTGSSSISLSEIQKLPGPSDKLSFVGGIQTDDTTPQTESAIGAFPKLETVDNKENSAKASKRRPR